MNQLPVASFVYSEDSYSKGCLARDTRKSERHPLRHSVMNLVRDVALVSNDTTQIPEGLKNGQNYLLTSRTLFTTHEPCIMCSMALLHSRVKEVFYIYPMPQTGGCGGLACIPGLKGVNHRYGIWRWKAPDSLGDPLIIEATADT
jgi:tRNA-specific adenosine deaminase 3